MSAVGFLCCLLLPQQGAAPTLRAHIDRQEMTVGDRVTITITVDHDPAQSVDWPSPSKLGAFDVLETHTLDAVTSQGRTSSVAAFTITAFEVGELEVPPVEVMVGGPPDSASVTLASDPIPLRVVTIGVDDAADIRDIKPPLGIPRNWVFWIVSAVVAMAAIGAGTWAYRRYRRRQVQTSTDSEPLGPPRPAHEWALEALDRLDAAGLPERGEIQRHYSEAAEIIRTYLERRFGIVAMEMVSQDIIADLETRLDDATVNRFRAFFRDVDLVKFAKYRPALDACRSLVPAARHLVEVTKVPEEPGLPPFDDAEGQATSAAPEVSVAARHGSVTS